MSTESVAHRDAIEAIAAQLERLATTVRTLIPERDPVAGQDYLPQPYECACGPACIHDIKLIDADRYHLWPKLAVSTGAVMHADVPVREWGELP